MYGYIYQIENKINGRKYIGKRKSPNTEDSYMGSGKILKQAFEKYGIENFAKSIIDYADSDEELSQKEIYWIDHFNAIHDNQYYNIASGGTGGYTIAGYTEEEMNEYRQRMSQSLKGRISPTKGKKASEETKAKMSKSLKGRKISEQQKLQISAVHKGKIVSAKSRKKMSESSKGQTAWNKGLEMNEDYKKKISEATKQAMQNPEVRKKISEALKGKPGGMKGKTMTEESKKKMSKSAKNRQVKCICKICDNEFFGRVWNASKCENCKKTS